MSFNINSYYINRGFTLIETIVGIVVLSVAFSIMTTLIYPSIERSASQVHQIKAAELGQSLLNEILGRAFDENSDMIGGMLRCGESGIDCTANNLLGNEEANRALFDDVDDYHGLLISDNNALGNDLEDIYQGYSISVTVQNDSDYDGDNDGSDNNYTAKLITVSVTTPIGDSISFSAYKANF